jgi:adenine-specific DNA-methyltransferase
MAKAAATYQKLRGGYYTPPEMARFLCNWAIQSEQDSVLEPSCGDGAFLRAARGRITAVEFDPDEAEKATRHAPNAIVHNDDFFAVCDTQLIDRVNFDAVVGNPPFIRYQNFPEAHREIAFRLMRRAGMQPNRLTNAWLPFLVVSSLLLKPGGRLAMVIPAELLQVTYAAPTRNFLVDFFSQITLITFRELVFDTIQQEVVLLLAERGTDGNADKVAPHETLIRTVELDNIHSLDSYSPDALDETAPKAMDHQSEKWTRYFLDQPELDLLRTLQHHPGLIPAGKVIDVDVGIVTGLNEFFVINHTQVEAEELDAYAIPLVGRSGHLAGTVFTPGDWQALADKDVPSFLVALPQKPNTELPLSAQKYIAIGEAVGANLGFKCRTRKFWYSVPSVYSPDAFMLRQIHAYPKLIVNRAGAVCTDTIHRVRLRQNPHFATMDGIAGVFLNSLSFAFAETIGRSYGGGVLELEPNEAEHIPIPMMNTDRIDLTLTDQQLRAGAIAQILDENDRVLLKDGLGLSEAEARMLRAIWQKLRDRRIGRKRSSARS